MDDRSIRSWPIPRGQAWYPAYTRRWLSGRPDQGETVRQLLARMEHSSADRSFTSHLAYLIQHGVLMADMRVDEAARTIKAASRSGDLPEEQCS